MQIQKIENKFGLIDKCCELTSTSLSFTRDINQEEWQQVYNGLSIMDKCVQFWIGDCLKYHEQKWGMYDDMSEKTNLSKKALKNIKYTATAVEASRRRDNLSFAHHEEVAPLEPEQQEYWLDKSEKENLNRKQLRTEIKKDKSRTVNDLLKDKYDAQPPDQNIQVWHGDFYELCKDIPDNSIDGIITDPPYPIEYHHVWGQLGEVAARVLKPSAFLISYSGQIRVNQVMSGLDKYLIYYWMCSLIHTGPTTKAMGRNMICGWKPILIYQKAPFKKLSEPRFDTIDFDKRDKEHHEWGQGEIGVSYFMEYFTRPNDLILEPFSGGGTTPYVAKKMSRRCIAIDNDLDAINSTKGRLLNNGIE